MERLYGWALKLIIALNVVATLVSFGESYSGNYQWSDTHGVAGFWAYAWPLMVDLIILIGEAALFAGHYKKWRIKDRVWSWSVTLVAVGVSTAANTGHVQSSDWLSHLTAALPPIALMFCMTVGFGVMKRVHENAPAPKPQPSSQPLAPSPATVLTPVSHRPPETVSQPLTETPVIEPSQPLTEEPPYSPERPAPVIPESLEPTETFAGDFKVVPGKSFTMPRDPRPGLELVEKRVRDMYDVDPDISVNAAANALGIAWATAKKYLEATKEARGLAA